MAKAARMKGRRKCRAKKRFNVGLLTENPPHRYCTRSLPIKGIAENKFVITVAPQKDICPQGSTYPRNAVAITIRRMVTPLIHVFFMKNELKYTPRPIWE